MLKVFASIFYGLKWTGLLSDTMIGLFGFLHSLFFVCFCCAFVLLLFVPNYSCVDGYSTVFVTSRSWFESSKDIGADRNEPITFFHWSSLSYDNPIMHHHERASLFWCKRIIMCVECCMSAHPVKKSHNRFITPCSCHFVSTQMNLWAGLRKCSHVYYYHSLVRSYSCTERLLHNRFLSVLLWYDFWTCCLALDIFCQQKI